MPQPTPKMQAPAVLGAQLLLCLSTGSTSITQFFRPVPYLSHGSYFWQPICTYIYIYVHVTDVYLHIYMYIYVYVYIFMYVRMPGDTTVESSEGCKLIRQSTSMVLVVMCIAGVCS